MPRSVWNEIVSWRTKRLTNSTKYLLHASMTIISKRKEMKSVGELSKVSSQIVMKCLYLARIGRPDILWSVNKLARSITRWTKACDKRLCQLISYIHHTCEYKQYCYVGNTAKQCRLGLFQDSDFAGDVEDSKSTSGGTLCILGSHTFVPISWMCKKQTSVSHSSTGSEIISLDAGLRLDGIPALDLWDLIVAVLFTETRIRVIKNGETRARTWFVQHLANFQREKKSHGMIDDQDNVDFISSNVHSSRQEALLYVFEDNDDKVSTYTFNNSMVNFTDLCQIPGNDSMSASRSFVSSRIFDLPNFCPTIACRWLFPDSQVSIKLCCFLFTCASLA